MKLGRRAQSTLEYALLIAVVVGALVAMQVYMKQGVQGKLKESGDQIGKQFDPASYEYSWQDASSGTTITTEERVGGAGATGDTTSDTTASETVTRSEHETWGSNPTPHFGTE